ncbi:hypothetical protein HOF65_07440 [bacterium]|nr:hypothetical protein [bacterium]MBT4632953.1 hypothetical protein [bacterium]
MSEIILTTLIISKSISTVFQNLDDSSQLIFDKIDDKSVFSGNFIVDFKLILSLVIFFTSISEIEKESNSVEIIFVK